MIVIIYGKMGCGKTLLATYFLKRLLDENPNVKAIANYHIDLPQCEYRKIPLPVDTNENIVIIDDIYAYPTWFQNFILRVIVLLSRKRNITIIITTQRLAVLMDKTIRLLANIINPIRLTAIDNGFKVRCIESIESAVRIIPIRFRTFSIPREITNIYDTNEIIMGLSETELLEFITNIENENLKSIYMSAIESSSTLKKARKKTEKMEKKKRTVRKSSVKS